MIIRGEKVVLRPIVLADAPRFLRWVNDPETNKLLAGGRKRITLKEERLWIRSLVKKAKTEKQFAIDTKDGVHIGSTGFRIDAKNKKAIWGILIGDKRYWGKGCGTEVVRLMLRYGFATLKLHRIELGVYAYNTRALALYTSAGFKKEGVRRKATCYKGAFYDEILMAMLREEWSG